MSRLVLNFAVVLGTLAPACFGLAAAGDRSVFDARQTAIERFIYRIGDAEAILNDSRLTPDQKRANLKRVLSEARDSLARARAAGGEPQRLFKREYERFEKAEKALAQMESSGTVVPSREAPDNDLQRAMSCVESLGQGFSPEVYGVASEITAARVSNEPLQYLIASRSGIYKISPRADGNGVGCTFQIPSEREKSVFTASISSGRDTVLGIRSTSKSHYTTRELAALRSCPLEKIEPAAAIALLDGAVLANDRILDESIARGLREYHAREAWRTGSNDARMQAQIDRFEMEINLRCQSDSLPANLRKFLAQRRFVVTGTEDVPAVAPGGRRAKEVVQ